MAFNQLMIELMVELVTAQLIRDYVMLMISLIPHPITVPQLLRTLRLPPLVMKIVAVETAAWLFLVTLMNLLR